MATKQLGTPSDRPEDAATQETVDDAVGSSPDAGAASSVQGLIDTIFRALADDTRINNTSGDLQLALVHTRPTTMDGVFGPENVATTLQALLDVIAGKTGASLADAIARLKKIETQADLGARAWVLTEDHEPETHYFSAAGTIQVPSWANYVDLRAIGKGGKGAVGGTTGQYGQPGTPGAINSTTLQRTEHFTGTPTITITVANQSVANTTAVLGAHTLTATDGSNGQGTTLTKPVGPAPVSFTHKGTLCQTSGDQNVLGANGTSPGGAGNGQHWLLGRNKPVAIGGNGGVWVTFRADPVEDEEVEDPEGDTTPPDVDDLDVDVTAALTSLTLTPSGAVDA